MIIAAISNFFDPQYILNNGGIVILLVFVFLEAGIIFGFMFPADSLLFTAGLLCGSAAVKTNIFLLNAAVIASGLLGAFIGYYTGVYINKLLLPSLKTKPFMINSIEKARDYHHKYDRFAFLFGRFIPVVRTFLPIFSGLVHINIKRFFFLNLVGFSFWSLLLTLSGYYSARFFPKIIDHLPLALLILVLITTLPFISIFIPGRKKIRERLEKLVNKYVHLFKND